MDLIGDIGGTHARLALATQGRIVRACAVEVTDDAGLHAAMADFVAAFAASEGGQVRAICMAGAGLVTGSTLPLTNRNLTLRHDTLQALFGPVPVRLVNDMIGQAHGIDGLPPALLRPLAGPVKGPVTGQGPRILMNIGTGLNTCVLTGHSVPVAEAGHASLPQTDAGLRAFAAWRGGRAIAEDVLSGRGLSLVARHLTGRDLSAPAAADLPEVRALFAAALAEHLADMVLVHMATGGVVLTAGVAVALADTIDWGALHRRMAGTGPYAAVLAAVPLHLALADDLVLRGCARLAARL